MVKRKPGKYDHLIDGLPVIPLEDDPKRQARIDKLKEAHQGKTAVDLVAQYAFIKFDLDAKNEEAAALQIQLDALKQLLIASEDEGNDPAWGAYGANDNAVKLPDGSTLRVNKELSSKLVDPDAFRQWCIDNGYERKLQLHAGTREQIVAERALAAEPMPDGVEIGSWSKVTFTPGKEK